MAGKDRPEGDDGPAARTHTPAPRTRRGERAAPARSLERHQPIGVWVVDRQLGKGGMASVYKCFNRHAHRIEAAIKLLDPALSHEGNARARFVREAEILFGLDHPHIVRVSSVNLDNMPPYLEMEYVRGKSIEEELALRGALPVQQAISLTQQLVSALDYLHRRGVYHRDIKPMNLLLQPDGRLKLVDFGLAVEASGERITHHGSAFGTPSYAPPEWADPVQLDPVSWDLYATGVVLYEMLTGEVAFPVMEGAQGGRAITQVILAKQQTEALDPGAGYPGPLRQLVKGLTARDPASRPRSAREVTATLAALGRQASGPTLTNTVDALWQEIGETHGQPDAVARRPDAGADTVVNTARPPARPTGLGRLVRRGCLPAVTLGAFVGLGAALVVVFAVVTRPPAEPPPPAPRSIAVVVAGLAQEQGVAVTVTGAVPAGRDGFTWSFREVEPGEVELIWAIGQGCTTEVCPGAGCPAWCVADRTTVAVPPGEGIHTVPVTLTPPPPRDLRWSLVDAPDGEPVVVEVDGVPAPIVDGTATAAALRLGVHTVHARVGSCPEPALGCADALEPCPPGCASWSDEVTVGAGEGPVTMTAPVRGWTPRRPAPVAAARRGPVTRAAFAAWLADHPQWHRDAAIGGGTADANYLSGWVDGAPPGAASAAMVNVSWWAAEAYCRGRGGLVPLDETPLTWTATAAQPSHEWRIDQGSPAWRREDGATSHAGPWEQTNSATGFRCAR